MNPWSRIGILSLGLALSACSPKQADNQEQAQPSENVTNVLGGKLEAVRLELGSAFELVPKVPIEEQNLYLEKGLSALFHYGNAIAVAKGDVEALITMEEMSALIPEGPQKEKVLERVASAYQSTSDSFMLAHLVGQDFTRTGKLENDEALRNTVELVEEARTAFTAILAERRPLIEKSEQRKMQDMYDELEKVRRDLEKAGKATPDKN